MHHNLDASNDSDRTSCMFSSGKWLHHYPEVEGLQILKNIIASFSGCYTLLPASVFVCSHCNLRSTILLPIFLLISAISVDLHIWWHDWYVLQYLEVAASPMLEWDLTRCNMINRSGGCQTLMMMVMTWWWWCALAQRNNMVYQAFDQCQQLLFAEQSLCWLKHSNNLTQYFDFWRIANFVFT